MTVIGDTIYFDAPKSGLPYVNRQLWAHDTSNKTSWIVHDFSPSGGQGISKQLMVVGDTIYFRACGYANCVPAGLWAHDTSNQSTWLVENGSSGDGTSFFVDGTLYTHTGNCNGYSPGCTLGYNLLSINYQTNTGGNVTTWAINGSLPSGLSFGTNNGTIYGTPTELWTQTSYMVWANNSGGSSVAYLNITIVDDLPTLSYAPSTLVLTINNQSSDLPLNASLQVRVSSPRGKSTQPCHLDSTSVRATERFGVFRPFSRQRRQPTRFGPTTRAVQPRPPLRLRSTTRHLVRSNTSQRTTPGPTIPT